MMVPTIEHPREALQRLIEENKEEYAALSRLIGRNPAYIQQFIKRALNFALRFGIKRRSRLIVDQYW